MMETIPGGGGCPGTTLQRKGDAKSSYLYFGVGRGTPGGGPSIRVQVREPPPGHWNSYALKWTPSRYVQEKRSERRRQGGVLVEDARLETTSATFIAQATHGQVHGGYCIAGESQGIQRGSTLWKESGSGRGMPGWAQESLLKGQSSTHMGRMRISLLKGDVRQEREEF